MQGQQQGDCSLRYQQLIWNAKSVMRYLEYDGIRYMTGYVLFFRIAALILDQQ